MKKIISLFTILACALLSRPAFSQDAQPKDLMLGLKLGYLGSGTVRVAGAAFGTTASHDLGVVLDYKVAPKLYMSMHFFMHNFSVEGISENMMDIGGSFKAVIPTRNERVMLRPSLNMGYGALPEIQIGKSSVDSSSYFLIGPSMEIIYNTMGNYDLVGEIGFISAPTGGNSDFTVTLGPTLILRGGIYF